MPDTAPASSPAGSKFLAQGFCKAPFTALTGRSVNANRLKKNLKTTWGAPTVQIPPDLGMKSLGTG